MKGVFLALICVVVVSLIVAGPVRAFDGEPPTTPNATPVVAVAEPVFKAPAWVGFLLIFLLPLAYMLYRSIGKKLPDLQPPGAEVPVFDENSRPFKPYDDEDEDEPRK